MYWEAVGMDYSLVGSWSSLGALVRGAWELVILCLDFSFRLVCVCVCVPCKCVAAMGIPSKLDLVSKISTSA